MPDSKHLRWADDFGKDAESPANESDAARNPNQPAANDAARNPHQPAANDADGWQQYRQWISKAPAPRSRRVGIDPALYSWKGYRNWTEQIRRNWSRDLTDDSE